MCANRALWLGDILHLGLMTDWSKQLTFEEYDLGLLGRTSSCDALSLRMGRV